MLADRMTNQLTPHHGALRQVSVGIGFYKRAIVGSAVRDEPLGFVAFH